MWNRPNINGGTYEEGGNVKKLRRESRLWPRANSEQKLSAEWETQRPEPKTSSQDGCWVWTQMKILYLHYCAIYPPRVVLQRDTKRASLLQVRVSAVLHFSPHLQLHKDLKLSGKTTIWADLTISRCRISNKFDFALLGIYFWTLDHILYFCLALFYISFTRSCPGGKCQHQKRQTSNTILTQAISNEVQTVSGIKGPRRFTAKLWLERPPTAFLILPCHVQKAVNIQEVPLCAQKQMQRHRGPHIQDFFFTPSIFIANKHSKMFYLKQ